jgi:RNA 2',3'-cyclic 3'-phosphodiesterase
VSDQLDLFGEGTSVPKRRIFFALVPDAQAAEAITQLAESMKAANGLKGNLIKPEHLHMTLHHLGDHPNFPYELVEQASRVGKAIRAMPFQFTLDRVMSFNNRNINKPFVLTTQQPSAELIAFQKNLGLELIKAGLKQFVDKQFTPHSTMLYDPLMLKEQVVEPITWKASEFVLVDSHLGETHHEHLQRWPLSALSP